MTERLPRIKKVDTGRQIEFKNSLPLSQFSPLDRDGFRCTRPKLPAAPGPGGPQPWLPGPSRQHGPSVGSCPGLPHCPLPLHLSGCSPLFPGGALLHQTGAQLGGRWWPPPPWCRSPLPQCFYRPLLGAVHRDWGLQVRCGVRGTTSSAGPEPTATRGRPAPPPAPQQDVQQSAIPDQLHGHAAGGPQPDR